MLDAGDFAACSFLDPFHTTSTILPNQYFSAASLVINLLTGHHPNSDRTSGISLHHHGVSIPDLIPRMCQTSILRFHPLELEFMKDTEVLKDAYLRYEEMGQRCKGDTKVSPRKGKMELIFGRTTVHCRYRFFLGM